MNTKYRASIHLDRLMMHNEQLANPFNEYAQELGRLTKKRGKSLDDHKEIAHIEFQGGLYFDDQAGPYIPNRALNKMLVQGARRRKLGKTFEQMVMIESVLGPGNDVNPLAYAGPRTRAALWTAGTFMDQRLVGVNAARTLRTRPLFRDCSCEFYIVVADGAVNGSDVQTALDAAQTIGLLDGRPIYAGQFTVTKFEKVEIKKAA